MKQFTQGHTQLAEPGFLFTCFMIYHYYFITYFYLCLTKRQGT